MTEKNGPTGASFLAVLCLASNMNGPQRRVSLAWSSDCVSQLVTLLTARADKLQTNADEIVIGIARGPILRKPADHGENIGKTAMKNLIPFVVSLFLLSSTRVQPPKARDDVNFPMDPGWKMVYTALRPRNLI